MEILIFLDKYTNLGLTICLSNALTKKNISFIHFEKLGLIKIISDYNQLEKPSKDSESLQLAISPVWLNFEQRPHL